jgi:heme/copper-type cytochrome/quinol oxidase subunit 2
MEVMMHSYSENTAPLHAAPVTHAAPVALEASAVSWGAIIAGAIAAAILSLILLLLGTGFGFSAISPWSGEGISATTFGVTTVLWVTFVSLAASALGGYLAGRLRSRWTTTHVDEIYFRDTAHGFLAWAVSTLITVTLLTSAVTGVVSGGVKAGAAIAGGAVATAASAGASDDEIAGGTGYLWDSLFRSEPGNNLSADERSSLADARTQVARIFVNAIRTDSLPENDARYVAGVIAEYTDVNQQEAERRVRDAYASLQEAEVAAKEAAETAAKATAYASLWLFISLLIGAFIASFAATFGGRQRDSAVIR